MRKAALSACLKAQPYENEEKKKSQGSNVIGSHRYGTGMPQDQCNYVKIVIPELQL